MCVHTGHFVELSVCVLLLVHEHTFIGAPIITSVSKDTVSAEGSSVTLMCNATNDIGAIEELKIVWLQKTSSLREQEMEIKGYKLIYSTADSFAGKIHSLLQFYSVNRTDDGEYICRAFNHPKSYTEAKVNLTIECKLNVKYQKSNVINVIYYTLSHHSIQ